MSITQTLKSSKEEILEENLALLLAIGERIRSKKGERIWKTLQQFIESRPNGSIRYGSRSPFKDDPKDELQLRPSMFGPVTSVEFLLLENAQLRDIIEQEARETMPADWRQALWPSARLVFENSRVTTEDSSLQVASE